MLRIKQEVMDEIYVHARESYPGECCGILVGKANSEKEAIRVHKVANVDLERPRISYKIDPQEIFTSDRGAREAGLKLVGFYHSHPDHPPYPSPFDAEGAWPWYSYLIVSVLHGQEVAAKSWVWNEGRKEFEEEPLVEVV